MSNLRKKLSVSLCLALSAVLLFTACGSEKSADSTTTTSAVSSTSQEVQKIHTLKLMGPDKFPAKYMKWEDRVNFPSWKLYEEQLAKRNLKLEYEFIAPEQYTTVIQTRLAAAVDLPDIVNISPLDDATALNLGLNGTLVDINSAIQKYSDGTINKRYDGPLAFSKRLNTAPDGNRYWFSTALPSATKVIVNGTPTQALEVINSAIRKDWLDKLKLPIPTTIEEWKADLKAFRDNDMNGNKVKDEVLMFDPYSYSFFTGIAQWFGLVPDIIAVDPTTQKVVSPWYQEGVKDYFKLMNELAKEGIFDVSLVGATEEVGNQRIAENKIAGLRSYSDAGWFEGLIKDVPEAQYVILPPLKAKEGITPFMLCDAADLSFDKFAITKGCKDVEGAIKLFDYIFSDEYGLVSASGVKDVDFKVNDKGENEAIDKTKTNEQLYKENRGQMSWFVSNRVFPRIGGGTGGKTIFTVDEILATKTTEKSKYATQRRYNLMGYRPYVTSPFSTSMYAIASASELETTNKYYTSLKTYSEELAMNLILGNESLDNWDKYISKLKELGLDEMMKVYQARYDRYVNAK